MSDKKDPKSDAKEIAATLPPETLAALKALVSELMPATAAVAAQAAAQAARPQQVAAPRRAVDQEKCGECGQAVETGCGGKHVTMKVWPDESPEFFAGVGINGVWYKSKDPGHIVTVPENAAGTIGHMVNMWDQNERELRTGKKRFRNSGTIGPGGGNVRPLSSSDFFR